MNFKYSTLIVVVLVAVQFSQQKVIKSVKRHNVYKGHQKYEVGLSINKHNITNQLCAGSLINPKFILTSGRCARDALSMKIFAGTKLLHEKDYCAPSAKFKNSIAHDGYDYYNQHRDIGIVELQKPLKLSHKIAFVELSTISDSTLLIGKIGRVTGFNEYTYQNSPPNNDLKEVQTKLLSIDNKDTNKHINSTQLIGKSWRWGKPWIGALGAPLMLEDTNIQIGIVSFSDFLRKPTDTQSFVYTNVGSYLDWINERTRFN